MHELSIAEALIEQVEREVHRAGRKGRVLKVELSIGRLSGVHHESLKFALDLLAPGTLVEKALVEIRRPKVVCVCGQCGGRSEIDQWPPGCPLCGSDQIMIEGGRELLLESIELEDD